MKSKKLHKTQGFNTKGVKKIKEVQNSIDIKNQGQLIVGNDDNMK